MKKYEYVSISYKTTTVVASALSGHREVIDSYAAKGFRYVDAIITEVSGSGHPRRIDLVFEKDLL